MRRALRFCLLATFYPPASFGGDAMHVERLARALADSGQEVTVVHSPEAYRALAPQHAPRKASPRSTAGHPRVRVVAVEGGFGGLSPLATYLSGRPLTVRGELERALDDRFDVLHFHNPSLLGGPAGLQMGRGIKLYTAHEQWLVCPTHLLWKYKRRVCERPTCWRCCAVYGRPPQLWRSGDLVQRSLERIDALIVPSATSARLHERFAPIVRIERLPHFVPEPVDADSAADPPRALAGQDRPFFLYAGRLESIKGIEPLIDAFRRPRPADLLIAGTGTQETSLRRAARDLPQVRLVGWVEPTELGHLFERALAVIVPTLGHESFGLVPVEAWAHGTPAIVHRFGALAELIEASEGGIAFSSARELDEAIDRIVADAELRQRLGDRGRAAYLERWTPRIHLSRYFGLIAELAGERGDSTVASTAGGLAAEAIATG